MSDLMTSSEMDVMNEQGKCILIIEDDRDIRQSLQVFFYELGFDAFTASNGDEALKLLSQIPKPSLFLLDLMMPVMNGWEFQDEISKSETYAAIPIIVMTAMHGEIPLLSERVIVRKPIDFQNLVSTVEQHCLNAVHDEWEDGAYPENLNPVKTLNLA